MALIVLGPDQGNNLPLTVSPPLIDVKASWSDDWTFRPDLHLARCRRVTGAQGLSELEVWRRFGEVKEPHESDFSTKLPEDLLDFWVRLRFIGEQGLLTAFVGRISSLRENVEAAPDDEVGGLQAWTALGPMHDALRTPVRRSFWDVDSVAAELGWSPAFNSRDETGSLVGNRSSSAIGGSYLFGGTGTWTRGQALAYVVAQFLDRSAVGGPAWTVGGQAEILEASGASDTIPIPPGASAGEMLRRICDAQLGLSFVIEPTAAGFEVRVFALLSQDFAYDGADLPRNPNRLEVVGVNAYDLLSTKVVRSADHRYRRLRVVGERIVSCVTLRGRLAPLLRLDDTDASLVAQWTSAAQAAYAAGTGTPEDDAELHDGARRAPRYSQVFTYLGAPEDWGFQLGEATPTLDSNGEVVEGEPADQQRQVRKTLTWIPLRSGVDYSDGGEEDSNPAWVQPDFEAPFALVYDPNKTRHELAEKAGFAVSVPQQGYGIILRGQPAHRLALNHWSGAAASEHDPVYDYEYCLATIAFRTDQRLELTWTDPDFGEVATEREIRVSGAEFWWLAPGTIVGVTAGGSIEQGGSSGRVLRNDNARLAFYLTGAISRYLQVRARAALEIAGWKPWASLLGYILNVIKQGNDTQDIQAPITEIEWTFAGEDGPRTRIRTGHATNG